MAIEEVFEEFGAPDVVVNNAGIVRFAPLATARIEDFRAVVDVNLVGTFIVARAAARRWIDTGRPGCIVNVTSMNGAAAGPNSGAYGASKAAIALLTSQMALEWGHHGIRVNAVAPGLIDAGMSEPIYADPDTRYARESKIPLGRLGTAADVAEVVLFLASDARRLRPRAEHPGRRGRHRLGDRPPAATSIGRLGGSPAVSTVVVLAGGLPHAHDFDAIARTLAGLFDAEHEVRTVAHPDQLTTALDGADALVVDALWWTMQGDALRAVARRVGVRDRPTLRAAVERFVAGGGGLLAVHTASICFDDWPEWGRIVGGAWDWSRSSHPPCDVVSPRVIADHPVVAGVADVLESRPARATRCTETSPGSPASTCWRSPSGNRRTTINRSCGPTATAPAGWSDWSSATTRSRWPIRSTVGSSPRG